MRPLLKGLSFLLIVLLLPVFAGCGKKAPPARKQAVRKPAPVQQAAATPAVKAVPTPEVYNYDAKGRRDPFTSLIKIAKERQRRKKSSNPMENFDVSEMKLTAIVWGGNGHYALITLPDNKSYTIREGMTLGLYGGKVEKITRDSVLVREHIKDYRGRLETKDTTLRLRKEGE